MVDRGLGAAVFGEDRAAATSHCGTLVQVLRSELEEAQRVAHQRLILLKSEEAAQELAMHQSKTHLEEADQVLAQERKCTKFILDEKALYSDYLEHRLIREQELTEQKSEILECCSRSEQEQAMAFRRRQGELLDEAKALRCALESAESEHADNVRAEALLQQRIQTEQRSAERLRTELEHLQTARAVACTGSLRVLRAEDLPLASSVPGSAPEGPDGGTASATAIASASSTASVAASAIPQPFKIGDSVDALFKDGRWYAAKVAEVWTDGRFLLDWNDNDPTDRIKTLNQLRGWVRVKKGTFGSQLSAGSDSQLGLQVAHPSIAEMAVEGAADPAPNGDSPGANETEQNAVEDAERNAEQQAEIHVSQHQADAGQVAKAQQFADVWELLDAEDEQRPEAHAQQMFEVEIPQIAG